MVNTFNRYNEHLQKNEKTHCNGWKQSKKKLWKNCYLDHFLFLPLSPLNNVEQNECAKLALSYVMGPQHYTGGEGGFLSKPFKIPIIICHWLSEIYKKRTGEVLCMQFQITHICFNELDYVTQLFHKRNGWKQHQNDAENGAMMVFR